MTKPFKLHIIELKSMPPDEAVLISPPIQVTVAPLREGKDGERRFEAKPCLSKAVRIVNIGEPDEPPEELDELWREAGE